LSQLNFIVVIIINGYPEAGCGKEYFSPILDPDADLDHDQHLITSKSGQIQPSLKSEAKSACTFCVILLKKPTDK